MNLAREELSNVFEMVCPWDALDDESLKLASEFAADEVRVMLPDIRGLAERSVFPPTRRSVNEVMAKEVVRRGRSIRNQWLREHHAYGDRRRLHKWALNG